MIEVFKTDVEEAAHAHELVVLLQKHFPASKINFDLHDCDKILRIDGHCDPAHIMALVQQNGHSCSLLE